MMEAAVVLDIHHEPIYWHAPKGRSTIALPDSRDLWDVIWESRANLLGIAHTHPGDGIPGPSGTDVTTFRAIEAGLGRKLVWWIASSDRLVEIHTDPQDYQLILIRGEMPRWLSRLRVLSYPI